MEPTLTTTTATTTTTTGATQPGGAAFEVEPVILIGAAGTMEAEADALTEATRRLRARLDALGPCWGTDVVGERFGAGYQPVAATVLANIGALTTGLVRIGAALRASANAYELTDTGIAPPEVPTPRPPVGGPLPPAPLPGGPEVPTPRPPMSTPLPPWIEPAPPMSDPVPPAPSPAPPMSEPLPPSERPVPDTDCSPRPGDRVRIRPIGREYAL